MPYCAECKKSCDTKSEDVGIGGYEFWGACGNDVQMVESSECCGAEAHETRIFDEDALELLYHMAIIHTAKPGTFGGEDDALIDALIDSGAINIDDIRLGEAVQYDASAGYDYDPEY